VLEEAAEVVEGVLVGRVAEEEYGGRV